MARGNGLADLDRRIKAMPHAARVEIGNALDQSANEIAGNARSLAPAEDGALKASVRVEAGAHELARAVEAGGPTTTRKVREGQSATYDYALAQELGTAEMPASPFFYPAWRLGQKRSRGRINRAVRKAAKTAGFE